MAWLAGSKGKRMTVLVSCRVRRAVVALWVVVFGGGDAPARAEDTPASVASATPTTVGPAVAECDRIGAIFLDPALPAGMAGIRTTELRAVAAEVACREALRADPDNSRIKAQLARALAERPEGRDEARLLFEQAFGAGHVWSAFGLAMLEQRSDARGNRIREIVWLKKVANQVPEARLRITLLLLGESPKPMNASELVDVVRAMAEQGFAEAMFAMGMFAQRGEHMPMNHNLAMQWLRRAAKAQHTEAMYQLALSLAEDGTESMQDEATDLFDRAAEKGHLDAMLKAADRQVELKWGRKNTPRALELYRRAEMLGSKQAMIGLARGYVTGGAGVKDPEQATEWYLKAAGFDQGRAGMAFGQPTLMLPIPEIAPLISPMQDPVRIQAMAGDASAMLRLGRLGRSQNIRLASLDQAVFWFRKAALAGEGEAMMFMGALLAYGPGEARDEKLADFWFERAANAGFRDASHALRALRGKDNEDARPFNSGVALAGYKHSREECAQLDDAMWLNDVDGAAYCIRIYKSLVGGRAENALVLMLGDTLKKDAKTGRIDVAEAHAHMSPAVLNQMAAEMSWRFRGPVFIVARPGSFGSTGFEMKIRHTKTEARIIDTVLTRIRNAEGVRRLDLVGQSGGGLMAFAMVKRRGDLRCVTAAAGALSIGQLVREKFGKVPPGVLNGLEDPAEGLDKVSPVSGLRLIVVHAKGDKVVSLTSAAHYVETARRHGLPVELVVAEGRDMKDHGVLAPALEKAYDCSQL